MDTAQLLALALLQGITEFLPISSSAHLLLPAVLLGWQDQGLAFDAIVHLATLLAVVLWFRRDLVGLLAAGWRRLRHGERSEAARLLGCLLLASLPILPVGYFGRFFIEAELRTGLVIAGATIGFALLLLLADWKGRRALPSAQLSPMRALLIGCAQCCALVPGASRAGVTITAALAAGFTREAAVRIAFLLAIPAIAGAAVLKLWDLATSDASQAHLNALDLSLAFALAAVTAYLGIALMLRLVERVGFLPFVLYRLALGCLLLLAAA